VTKIEGAAKQNQKVLKGQPHEAGLNQV
jgi:hypothetical protein